MKLKDVVIGGVYVTRIGAELARVVVIAKYENSRGKMAFRVRREGMDCCALPKMRTAAALRPIMCCICGRKPGNETCKGACTSPRCVLMRMRELEC